MNLRENIKNKLEETVVLEGFKNPLTEQYSHMYHIEWTDCNGSSNQWIQQYCIGPGPCNGVSQSCAVCPTSGPCNPSTALTPVVGMEISFSPTGWAGAPVNVITYVQGPNTGGGGAIAREHPVGCTTPCDTTTASPCAIQWFQNPNANWAANWITARDCTNYTWPSIHLEQQAIDIMALATTPQTGPYNSASDIWTAGQNSGLSPANQFIAKMAKAKYSQCQKQACNC